MPGRYFLTLDPEECELRMLTVKQFGNALTVTSLTSKSSQNLLVIVLGAVNAVYSWSRPPNSRTLA